MKTICSSHSIFRMLTFWFLFMVIVPSVIAQENELDGLVSDTKNDLLVVVGGGLAGAVLGLSTLSFVEEPKEHTRNILVGASLGIIAGVGYVAFSQANKTQDLIYGAEPEEEFTKVESIKNFGSYARSSWHYENLIPLGAPDPSAMAFNYSTKF